jgi:endonuclease YncB( thermonuclease family)
MAKSIAYCLLTVFIIISCANTEKVTEVIDGDTFRTKNGAVRLLGINAPEMNEPGGDIAKDILALMILNKDVRLERDITDKDDYGRLLRYVYQGNAFVNAEIVRSGYAEARFYPPDTLYKKYIEEIEKMAVRNSRGLWSFSVFQVPDTTFVDIQPISEKMITAEIISWHVAAK